MSDNNTLTVTLLDKDYQIACPVDEQDALSRAAKNLDGRLRNIRSSGQIIGLERIAIMAALNLSYELQQANAKSSASGLDEALLQSLSDKVQAALGKINS